jgi:FdrA protein
VAAQVTRIGHPGILRREPRVIASVCGTDADPQSYSRQRRELSDAGIVVAPSNAHAAEIAIALVAAIRAKRP